ncbi:MAG: S9 family peptidase [Kordiimonadaceae bacterium]|nr:S9 family peptidase [Kordiimonadaceae bacterium]
MLFNTASIPITIANEEYFQLEDMHKIQDVSAPSLSPDGKNVAYSISIDDLKTDKKVSDIWIIPYQGGNPKNLTKSKNKSEWSPQFSPDGKWIAYFGEGKDEGETQIFIMKTNGRSKRQISFIKGGVIDFDWAPDSKRIVLSAFNGGAEPSEAGTAPPIVIDRFQFKEDWVGYLAGARRQLHILDIKSGQNIQITNDDRDHWMPSWSPDGKWIAYISKDSGDVDRNLDTDVFIMLPEKDGESRRISNFKGTDVDPYWMSPPEWSPDSKKLVWLTSGMSKWIYYAPWQLTVGDIESGETRSLAWIDLCFYLPKWSGDGKYIYSLIEKDRSTLVARINVETEEISYLTEGNKFALGFDVSGNDHIVVQQSDDNTPYELFAVDNQDRALTNHNIWLETKKLANTEKFEFDSDGHDIGGLIVYPPDYDKNRRYPAIFRLHGGPVYQFSHEFMYDWQIYAAQGYIVVGINPRGSSGKGFDFAKAIYADWGNVDSRDILAGADYLTNKNIIDPERLALGGWSYGGILTDYVIATDSRFKAAISGAGAGNMLGMYGHDQYSREYELELGTPWKNREVYEKVSFPFLHADRIKTPTLYQCSEKDFNVPCLGAEQMYQALRSLDIESKLIIYPDQHHGIVVPSYLEDRMKRNLDWYNRYTQ